MSDAQVLVAADAVWFATNSDRDPSEPQPVVRLPGDYRLSGSFPETFLKLKRK
jgi:hypothetical protein